MRERIISGLVLCVLIFGGMWGCMYTCAVAINAQRLNGAEGVTLSQFNRVAIGMSYNDVCIIFEGDGKLQSETEIMNSRIQLYQWPGKRFGSAVAITFQDRRVQSIAQYHLD